MRVRWTAATREHRIGRASARYVMENTLPTPLPPSPPHLDDRLGWIGPDERGRELEVIVALLPDGTWLVTHVFPTALHRTPRGLK